MEKIVSLYKRRGFVAVPGLRDLRRPRRHLGLRAFGCCAQKKYRKFVVAIFCRFARRHVRHRLGDT
jgi:hypothetical protein